MRLIKAASYFDKTPMYDAYTGKFLFMGQTMPWDGKERDSVITQRRVISVQADIEIPTRRAIRVGEEIYIIGGTQDDVYRGEIIRRGLIVQQCQQEAQVQTIKQAALGQTGISAYIAVDWVKYTRYASESSDFLPDFNMYFASTEQVQMNSIITYNGEHYLSREVMVGQAGMLVVFAHRLGGTVFDTASTTTGVYDPITEKMTGSSVSFRVIRMRWECVFQYLSASAPTFNAGDIQVVVDVDEHIVEEGMRLDLSDGTWQVQSIITEGSTQFCRCVKHV